MPRIPEMQAHHVLVTGTLSDRNTGRLLGEFAEIDLDADSLHLLGLSEKSAGVKDRGNGRFTYVGGEMEVGTAMAILDGKSGEDDRIFTP